MPGRWLGWNPTYKTGKQKRISIPDGKGRHSLDREIPQRARRVLMDVPAGTDLRSVATWQLPTAGPRSLGAVAGVPRQREGGCWEQMKRKSLGYWSESGHAKALSLLEGEDAFACRVRV